MREKRIKRALLAAGVLGTLVFCLAPFLLMLLTGLSERPDFLGHGVPFQPTLSHLEEVLTARSLHFPDYLRNSLIVAAVSAVLSVAIASLAAYALTRLPLPGKAALLLFVLALSMFPPVSLLGYLFHLFAALGWIDTYQALIFPYVAWSLPLSLWILVSYFSQIPIDLDRAALIDGCSRLQVLRRIVLPVAAPGLGH